ncbi:MAG: hypothetical protein ACP5R5_01735 [Armatimonadota bacterium]
MYSLFGGYISQQTFTMCEHRGGVCGLTPALLPGYLARLAVVDDQIAEDELHLLRLIPLAWLRQGTESRFDNIPTEFGPVTTRVRLSATGRRLEVLFEPRFRTPPKRTVLHIPPLAGLEAIAVNGKSIAWDGKSDFVAIG